MWETVVVVFTREEVEGMKRFYGIKYDEDERLKAHLVDRAEEILTCDWRDRWDWVKKAEGKIPADGVMPVSQFMRIKYSDYPDLEPISYILTPESMGFGWKRVKKDLAPYKDGWVVIMDCHY